MFSFILSIKNGRLLFLTLLVIFFNIEKLILERHMRIKKVKIDTERLQKEKLIVLDIFSDEWKHLMLLPPQIKSKKTFTNPFLLVHFHFGYPLDS